MNYKRKVLKNGLRVITASMPSLESATVLVMVDVGSRYESRANSGISHFLEHMAFKGTEKRPSAVDISSVIDGMGGEFNAFTGKEYTGFYIKSAKSRMETSFDVLSDMLLHSKFDQREIEKEKGVILEELNLYEDTPARKVGELYERLLYGDTPMGWDIGGDKEVIKKVKREDFVKYLANFYSADNITIVVAGGVKDSQVEKLAEEYFGEMKSFEVGKAKSVVEDQKKPAIMVVKKKTEQAHLVLGVRTVDMKSEKRHALSVLAAIMGGGMSSRLFHEVREKRGLGYYVRSSSDEYSDCGTFVSSAGVDPKRVEEAIKVMMVEYRKVSGGRMKLGVGELNKAKELIKGHLVLDLEDSKSVAVYYAGQELFEEEIENPDEIVKKIDAVTIDEVEGVGKEFFRNQGLNLAVIGKIGDRQKLKSLVEL